MNYKKRLLQVMPLVVILSSSCSGLGGGGSRIPSSDNVLVVDLHTFMPTGSSGSADLTTITVTKEIADEFYEKEKIKIKWFTAKTLDGEVEEASADYIKAIQNGTMPAIGFSWSAFKDRKYYLPLDEYLDTPNEYLTEAEKALYPTWRDQFPEYLWAGKECGDESGQTIAIPLVLNPGPATGWFYNKNFFTENKFDIPRTWDEFYDLCTDSRIQGNKTGPFVYNQTAKITGWEIQFSIGPAFANALSSVTDTNHDGLVSEKETLEAVINGYFSPLESVNPQYYQVAQGCYYMLKEFYTTMLPSNWKTVNASTYWGDKAGTGLLRQNGLWALRYENGNNAYHPSWKYGAFPAPVVSSDSRSSLNALGLTEAAKMLKTVNINQIDATSSESMKSIGEKFVETIKPTPSLYLNLMKHGIYDNEKVKENAVKFLKFLSTPENVTKILQDHQGVLGGVSGTIPGVILKDWLLQEFPEVPTCKWPDAYIVANNQKINQALMRWIATNTESADDEFFSLVSDQQISGARAYKETLSTGDDENL